MFRIALCDDVPVYMERLADHIEKWAMQRRIRVEIKKFPSGEEVLFDLEDAGDFAAVFMDIELSGMDGVETALKIREQNRLVSIVFVSQYEQYFKQMFQIYPCQFIEKPVSAQKVAEVLDHIVEEHKTFFESFIFKFNRRVFNITLGDVLYFVSDKRMITIRLESGREYFLYEKLGVLEKELARYNNHFIRIHQSYLVNVRQIEQLYPQNVVMRNGDELPISRKRKNEIENFYHGLTLGRLGQ